MSDERCPERAGREGEEGRRGGGGEGGMRAVSLGLCVCVTCQLSCLASKGSPLSS